MEKELSNFKKLKGHLATIKTHRRIVRKWCRKMGIPFLGLTHDLSKYSHTEMKIYKYWTGTRSPHDTARDELGYSPSWYHHKTRNKHHWEYWVDSLEKPNAIKVPFKYVIEMFCDFVGAGIAYMGDTWDESKPLEYHLSQKKHRIYHPETLDLLELLFSRLKEMGSDKFIKWFKRDRSNIKSVYKYNLVNERFNYAV